MINETRQIQKKAIFFCHMAWYEVCHHNFYADNGHNSIIMAPQKQVQDGLIEEFSILYHLSKFEQIYMFWKNCPTPVLDCPSYLLIGMEKLQYLKWLLKTLEELWENEKQPSKFGVCVEREHSMKKDPLTTWVVYNT